jgi:hypothetical protein
MGYMHSRALPTIWTGLLLSAFGLLFTQTTARAQRPDTTKPPPVVHCAGPFSARRLVSPPTVDGRKWIAVNVQTGPAPAAVEVPSRRFSLTLADTGTDTGEFDRYRLMFQRGRAPAVRIDSGFTGWVYVTPDSRYIVTEPLYVLDVDAWKHYALFEALRIPNYTSIEAISRDGRRLLISRRDCAVDCRGALVEYYELTLPFPPSF